MLVIKLIELMAEFKAVKGWRVIVVFDAHLVPGTEQLYMQHDIEVIYTRKNETADERIEKLSHELKGRKIQIHVATSDMTEQNVVFGHGALRISARELEIELEIIQSKISQKVKTTQHKKIPNRLDLPDDIRFELEKMRRGLK